MRLINADAYMEKVRHEAKAMPQKQGKTFVTLSEWIMEKTPSIEPKQKWIPCSERLPEKKAQNYLIYYQDYLNGGFDYAVVPYLKTPYGWEFEFYNESNNCETLAWMPLPEPWKGADDANR